ncbi:MAG: choice-of-anchor L domain-containing protein [Bacteroidia bacterium]|nr:choice-of-anchor L domain-containing protein [Bacteroidia bacterium]
MKKLQLVTLASLGPLFLYSQTITVTPATTATDVQAFVTNTLLGGCVTASNIVYTGSPISIGTFTNGSSIIGFNSGVVMTSGAAAYSVGPNNSGNRSASNFENGDNDLNTLLNTFTNDACVIEFDFLPLSDTVRFTYVWGSEEYPEYVNSGYNDVFAFYLSGGPSNLPPTNIALIPGTSTPVSIDNVNQFTNSSFYINNAGGQGLQYDGYTVPLEAVAAVVPCQSYHIKLVVADVGDYIYDSAVFLKAGSFSAGEGVTLSSSVTSTGNNTIYEGCHDGKFTFSRDASGDLSAPMTIGFQVSGTATPGADYTAFPGSITIPAGQSVANLNLNTILDGSSEANETITITLSNAGCFCSTPPSATLTILNNNALSATISGPATVCSGQSITLTATPTGSFGPYNYSWSPGGSTASSITVSPGTTTTYSLTISDACSAQTASNTLTVSNASATFTIPVSSQCLQNNNFSFTNTGASGSGVSHNWTFGDGTSSTQENPSHTYATAGNFTVTHTISSAGGCSSSSTQNVTVLASPLVTVSTTNSACTSNTGTAIATVSGVSTPVTYSWNTTPVQTTPTATNLGAGVYTVTVSTGGSCNATATGTVSAVSSLQANITATTPTYCGGGTNGTATAIGVGGIQPYSYSWNTTPVQTSATATGLSSTNYIVTVTDAAGCTAFATATISQSNTFLVNVSSTNVTCNLGANGTATAFPQSGTPPFVVLWSSGQNTASISNLTAGTYTVTINDNGGCSGSNTATITQPSSLTATLTTSPVSCAGGNNGSASVSVSGGISPYTYLWGGGQNTASITNQSATSTSVLITDANGCTKSVSGNITQPQPLTISISSHTNITCFGLNNGTANAIASGGTTPYTFSWDNGQSTINANNLSAGAHTVTVTDARGCTNSASITITQPTQVVAGIASFTNVTCNSTNNGTASATASGGIGPYDFLWSGGQTTQSVNGLIPGSYTVTVTDFFGCSSTSNVTISNTPGISLSTNKTDVSCFGQSTGTASVNTLNGQAPFTYSWSNGQLTSTATNLPAGVVTVTVTDAQTCSGSTSITIVQPPDLNVNITGTTNVSCLGSSNGTAVSLASGGTSPYFYQWSNGQNTANANGLSAGSSTVVVTDNNGCMDSAFATIGTPTAVAGLVNVVSNASCNGAANGSLQVTASGGNGGYTYLWSNGQTAAIATNLAVGSYTVEITDALGCSGSASGSITQPTPISIQFPYQLSVSCNGLSDGGISALAAGGNPPYSLLWGDGQTTDTALGLPAGTITLTVTDNNGCSEIDSASIFEPSPILVSSFVIHNALCFGDSNATAGMTILGGSTPYTYAWSNGESGPVANSLYAGDFAIVVTDANGCFGSDSLSVTQPSPVSVSIIGTRAANCFQEPSGQGYAIATGGTAPYQFIWDNGESGDTALHLVPGFHVVAVVDSAGCQAATNDSISGPSQLQIQFTELHNPLCAFDNSGSITILPGGGTPGYTAFWTNGQTGMSAIQLEAGAYTVTLVDSNGCSAQADTFLNNPPVLVISSISTVHLTCNGYNNGRVMVHAEGGTLPYTFAWDNGGTDSIIGQLDGGNYNVVVTDSNGCTVQGGATVLEPDTLEASVLGIDDPSCFGSTNGSGVAFVIGGTQPYSYFLDTVQSPTSVLNDLGAGTYTLYVMDDNSCRDTVIFSLTQPQQVVTIITGTDSICLGGSVQLEASASGGNGIYSYNWPGLGLNDTLITVTPVQDSLLIAVATDFNGCLGLSDTFGITVVMPPNITFTQSAPGGCGAPSLVQFENTTIGTTNVNWDFGNGFVSTINTPSTSYTSVGTFTIQLVGSNAFGCTDSTSSTYVVSEMPIASFVGSDSACNSVILTYDNTSIGAIDYLWIFGDGDTSLEFEPMHIFNDPGVFDVMLIARLDGCSDTAFAPASIVVYQPPIADFSVSGGQQEDAGIVHFVDNSQNGVQWSWSFGDGDSSNVQNPNHLYSNFGEYLIKFTVMSDKGCYANTSRTIYVELFKNLSVPNALIQGGEGETGLFLPKGVGLMEYTCLVYDKWGNLLWSSDKLDNGRPAEGWDGTYKGEAVELGSYMWKIEAKFADSDQWEGKKVGNDYFQTGSVSVIR